MAAALQYSDQCLTPDIIAVQMAQIPVEIMEWDASEGKQWTPIASSLFHYTKKRCSNLSPRGSKLRDPNALRHTQRPGRLQWIA
jgi:hypothetical protein